MSESAWAITGKTLQRADSRRRTLISAGDIVRGASDSSSESSVDELSGTRSGGVWCDKVLSERVRAGKEDKAARVATVMTEAGSIM